MLQSSNIPEAVLKKRHVNIAYHMCREQVAAKVITPIKVRTGDNVADTATKALEGGSLEHINQVLFAKPFRTEREIELRRMRIWYESIHKTCMNLPRAPTRYEWMGWSGQSVQDGRLLMGKLHP
jgi:hypothetical protein